VDCVKKLDSVPYWSVSGRTKCSYFRVVGVYGDYVEVEPEFGEIQRIPLRDFERVLEVWDQYKAGVVKRHEITKMTRFSSYIISIIHYCIDELEDEV